MPPRTPAASAEVRALVQRVSRAAVSVEGRVVGAIGAGLCVLVGVTHTDTDDDADRLARRVAGLRVLDDEAGGRERSLLDAARPAALVISQFTLYGDTGRGRRPSWSAAAPGPVAEPLVDRFCGALRSQGVEVATGVFGAYMSLELVNEGPVTVLLET